MSAGGFWSCENSSALRARRNISEKLRIMKLNHSAHIRLDTVLENCIFDRTGSFDLVWTAAMVAGIAAALCHLALHEEPRRLAVAEET